MADVDKLKSWLLRNTGEDDATAVRFDITRSFKGLEPDIVFLINIKQNSPVYTKADIYVGGSRARFLLFEPKSISANKKFKDIISLYS